MVEPHRTDGAIAARRRIETVAFVLVVFLSSIVPIPSDAPADGGGNGVRSVFDSLGASLGSSLGVGFTDPFHFVGYAILTVLLIRTTEQSRRGILVAVGAAIAFGFGIELVQSPIPWRSFAWGDAAVNAVGAVVGAGVVVVALPERRDVRPR